MSENNYPVIAIGRLYGAGGRSVAEKLSETLGIPWYDQDFVKKAAEMSGLTPEEIKKGGEQIGALQKLMEGFLPVTYSSESDVIQAAQEKAILELAKEPCIIIGRCANVVLREAKVPHISVFLYADDEHRIQRAAQLNENAGVDYKTYVARRDNRRATYYKTYTGFEQTDPRNYTLCLDTGLLGYDKCAGILAQLARDAAK